MTSDHVRTAVWNGWWDTNRLIRYYGELLREFKKRHLKLRIVIAASAVMLPVVALIEAHVPGWLEWATKILVAGSFLLSFGLETFLKKTKTEVLSQARASSHALDVMWRQLWFDIESGKLDDSIATDRCMQLEKLRESLISANIAKAELTENRELNIKCAREANQNMINMFHPAGTTIA